ncbi:MAG TPA: response regulator, partial [Methanotrichaceae archaeon]|nr:response regulator [Methanotrichaceae archaeon]
FRKHGKRGTKMRDERTVLPGNPTLRESAEKEVREKGCSANLSEVDVRALCHELEVHQIELEMQNEELKRVQMELAASKEEYQDLYEFAPIGYLTLEGSGKILKANLAAAALLGTERAHLANNLFQAYLAGGSVSEFKAFCRSVMNSYLKQTAELRLRGTGSNVQAHSWVLVEGRAVRDDINHGFRMAVIDISERKRGEEALLKARDELDQRVAERTEDLQKANRNLTTAKNIAEAALKAKAEFLANMSHEIRTPMNAVIGVIGLLLEEPLTEEQKDNLELVRINGDALLSIINDILDFSKMESDKVVLEEYQFNLRQCVEEAIDLVAFQAAEKGLNLAYTIDKGVPDAIISDPTRLRQVLGNLLSNAIKFTDEGDILLSASSQKNNDVQEIHFAVQDTGVGIPQDRMNLLFQPFNQMEPSTTRLYGGTGLGLAISKKLVEMMNGKIWAESEVNIGSTFHFTIKVPTVQSEPQPSTISPQLIGKRVLIVEDNKVNRRILSKQIYDWGMIPMAATSGREALKYILRGDNFDIAILDMDLQGMDSLELEEEIRKYNNTLPLVLLTLLGKRIPPNHAYLTKPIKPSKLQKVLVDILPRQLAKRPIKASRVNQPVQNSPLRILLAEDNLSSQKVAQQMLRKLGYKADIVANGIEALHALDRQHYDVVLMDVRMPEMDGLEATRIIRQRWPNDGPKIIAITAYALEGDREKCLEAGMNDYIAKPIQKEDLARALRDIENL